jgi:hypothetical protein
MVDRDKVTMAVGPLAARRAVATVGQLRLPDTPVAVVVAVATTAVVVVPEVEATVMGAPVAVVVVPATLPVAVRLIRRVAAHHPATQVIRSVVEQDQVVTAETLAIMPVVRAVTGWL